MDPEIQNVVPSHRRRRKKLKEKLFVPNFDIPGVHKIVLPEFTQQEIGCMVGEQVTSEKPWTYLEKQVIREDLEVHSESSAFLPLQNEIDEFPGEKVLVGYIPNEYRDYDEFYICITPDAIKAVAEIRTKVKQFQEAKLRNAMHRKIKKWNPLGSDKEVEEMMVKDHRSLIEVEIESVYPFLPFEAKFRLVRAQDMRSGYMELGSSDETLNMLYRSRVDAPTQAAPSVISCESQTDCPYPKNSFSQYDYELPFLPMQLVEKPLRAFMSKNVESLCDNLQVNSHLNIYEDDYEKLIQNEKYCQNPLDVLRKDYLTFVTMELCGHKMISSISWHPMWTGCFIAAYVDTAASLWVDSKITTEDITKAVHDSNPVLFWSFSDDLKPKLILETPRPIHALSCCPHDPNIVIGGCSNGQVVLWDITNKLTNVEEEEILNIDQQKNRQYMFSLMTWMKNIFDKALIRPTALSNLRHSHKGCINSISWMSPFHTVTRIGKIEEIKTNQPHSLEFITSAEDGTVMFWDLRKKVTVGQGGFRATKRMKRLKKKPSALLTMESPFKVLHLNLTPIYKINLVNHLENNRFLGIASCYMNFSTIDYEQRQRQNRSKLSDRVIFTPIMKLGNTCIRETFYVGTMEGDYIQGMWEGHDFDSGEIVNFENAKSVHGGKIHDGPVVALSYSSLNGTVLTVGGKIFALWKETFENRPIVWRKSKSIYTNGAWFEFEQATIELIRMDGYTEIWTLFYKSRSPVFVSLSSNGALNLRGVLPRKIKHKVVGVCDYRGVFRLIYGRHSPPQMVKDKEEAMKLYIDDEIERKKNFIKWQNEWNLRNTVKTADTIVEETEEITFEPSEPTKKEDKKKIGKISAGLRYLEKVQEEQKANAEARIKTIILTKKQLNREDLLKKSEPLRTLQEENEIKRKKQKTTHRDSEKIFKRQVAMLFPDIVRFKAPPPVDPYENSYSDRLKATAWNSYRDTSAVAQNYVEENPFDLEFSWRKTLLAARERRANKNDHRRRYEKYKETAAAEAEESTRARAEEAERLSRFSSASTISRAGEVEA